MTWETRDLPVLKTIIELTEEGQHPIEWRLIVERTGMSEAEVQRALNALACERPAFFEFTDTSSFGMRGREIGLVFNPTGYARRTAGAWPTAESLADQIIAGLNKAAEAEPDEEKRGRIKQVAGWLKGTGWSVLLGVAGNAVSKGVGL